MKKIFQLILALLLVIPMACNEDDEPLEKFTVYQDADGDGFGNPDESKEVTKEESGYVADNTDCDDQDKDVNPDATEIPDNDIDENCDDLKTASWYEDADGDGFGNPEVSQVADAQPTGYVSNENDCDDTSGDINPDADEIPDNEVDENCDEIIGLTWYEDSDGDDFGNADVSQVADTQPAGYVSNDDDCDDTDGDINPDAEEVPDNEVDENCDEIIGLTWYEDSDGDDFGNAEVSQVAGTQPAGYVSNDGDCDDTDSDINPDADEIDENCDDLITGTWYEDGDGYGNPDVSPMVGSKPEGYVLDNTDCDDTNGQINPGATEVTGDGLDNNCDGDFEAVCGDGVAEGPEDCDDGNLDDTDGCTSTCVLDSDGDGIPDSAEVPGCVNDPFC